VAWDVYLSCAKSRVAIAASKGCQAITLERDTNADPNCSPFGYLRRIKSLERSSVVDLPVYDFEVEEDHSFIAKGIVVHNCVGAGGGNCTQTLSLVDALIRNEPEEILFVYWLLSYGRSRFYMGDKNPGEGSLGSTFAKAAKEDGFLDARLAGLPEFRNGSGLEYGAPIEIAWSDGDAQQTLDLLPESRKYPVGTTAEMHSADDVRDALVNGGPSNAWGNLLGTKSMGLRSSWHLPQRCPARRLLGAQAKH
jgi:hypothetical protein